MKIICVGRNYAEHAKELENDIPKEPVLFIKSDNSLCNLKFLPLPEFSKDVHYELEICLKINKMGKYISEEFAHNYFDEITLGLDITARDIQQVLKSKGLPWEISKSFDNSCLLGSFINKNSLELDNLNFYLNKNNFTVQKGNSKDMIFNFSKIISYSSQFFTLKKGDIIMTGTPKGVGIINENDVLEGFLNEKKIFNIKAK